MGSRAVKARGPSPLRLAARSAGRASDRAGWGRLRRRRRTLPRPRPGPPPPEATTAGFNRVQRVCSPREPVLRHLKAAQRMARGRDQGFAGEQRHVSWAGLAWNTPPWGRLRQPRLLTAPQAHRHAA
jgi:hypothetical protein